MPGPFAVVDALGVPAVAFAARLPVAFEQRSLVIGEGGELGMAEGRAPEAGSDCNCHRRVAISSRNRPYTVTSVALRCKEFAVFKYPRSARQRYG